MGTISGGERKVYSANVFSSSSFDACRLSPSLNPYPRPLVYLPCIQNILGVMLFLRIAWMVGSAGVGEVRVDIQLQHCAFLCAHPLSFLSLFSFRLTLHHTPHPSHCAVAAHCAHLLLDHDAHGHFHECHRHKWRCTRCVSSDTRTLLHVFATVVLCREANACISLAAPPRQLEARTL
jgi:hypothetical protein